MRRMTESEYLGPDSCRDIIEDMRCDEFGILDVLDCEDCLWQMHDMDKAENNRRHWPGTARVVDIIAMVRFTDDSWALMLDTDPWGSKSGEIGYAVHGIAPDSQENTSHAELIEHAYNDATSAGYSRDPRNIIMSIAYKISPHLKFMVNYPEEADIESGYSKSVVWTAKFDERTHKCIICDDDSLLFVEALLEDPGRITSQCTGLSIHAFTYL